MDIDLSAHTEIVAVALLIAGLVGAHLAQRLAGRGLELLDRWLAQNAATADGAYLSPGLIRFTRALIFWSVVVVVVVATLRTLGVGGLGQVLDQVVGYVPRLVVGFAIVGAGHLLGLVCRGLLSRLSENLSRDSLLPRIVHFSIVVVAVVMGLQQMRIDITFVTQLLLVVLGIASGGLVLSFALGARHHVANLVARSELGRYEVGERIRVSSHEGTILEIRSTGVDIVTDEGVVSVPAARFSEQEVLRLTQSD
jgi:hypothetical protein